MFPLPSEAEHKPKTSASNEPGPCWLKIKLSQLLRIICMALSYRARIEFRHFPFFTGVYNKVTLLLFHS